MVLNLIFWLLTLVSTVVIYAACDRLHFLWVLLIVPGLYLACIVLYCLFLGVASLFLLGKAPKKSNPFCRFMIWLSMNYLVYISGLRAKAYGLEKIPDEPCIIVSNHRSMYDPLTLLGMLRKRKITYISKVENFKIPIAGPFICHAGYFGIDRSNGMRALRTLKAAADHMVKEKMDIGIYPEGTRSKNGQLLKFKTGAFYLAQKAQAPIVVMTTQGTEKAAHRFIFKTIPVRLDVIDILTYDEYKDWSLDEISNKVRELIQSHLDPVEGASDSPSDTPDSAESSDETSGQNHNSGKSGQ